MWSYYIVSLCLTVGSFAVRQPALVPREELTVIAKVLGDVQSNLQKLYDVTKTGKADPAPLLVASKGLIDSIKSGKTTVDEASQLTFIETVHLIEPVHNMAQLSEKLVDGMEELKPEIEKQEMCDVVRIQVSNINNASDALIASVNNKVDPSAKEISNELSRGITDVLKKSQEAFSTENCVNGRQGPPLDADSAAGRLLSTPFASSILYSLFPLSLAFMIMPS
jgi:hypothetical protein